MGEAGGVGLPEMEIEGTWLVLVAVDGGGIFRNRQESRGMVIGDEGTSGKYSGCIVLRMWGPLVGTIKG